MLRLLGVREAEGGLHVPGGGVAFRWPLQGPGEDAGKAVLRAARPGAEVWEHEGDAASDGLLAVEHSLLTDEQLLLVVHPPGHDRGPVEVHRACRVVPPVQHHHAGRHGSGAVPALEVHRVQVPLHSRTPEPISTTPTASTAAERGTAHRTECDASE